MARIQLKRGLKANLPTSGMLAGEVMVTTGMVFLLASLAAFFFFLVDLAIRSGLAAILTGFGS